MVKRLLVLAIFVTLAGFYTTADAQAAANNTTPSASSLATFDANVMNNLDFSCSPNCALVQQLFDQVNGQITGSTSQIITATAAKWGWDPNLMMAVAENESHLNSTAIGNCSGQPGCQGSGGGAGDSIGLFQIKSIDYPSTCPNSAGAAPAQIESDPTCLSLDPSFNADYYMASRTVAYLEITGQLSKYTSAAQVMAALQANPLNAQTPGAMAAIGEWYSGADGTGPHDNPTTYQSSATAQGYIAQVLADLGTGTSVVSSTNPPQGTAMPSSTPQVAAAPSPAPGSPSQSNPSPTEVDSSTGNADYAAIQAWSPPGGDFLMPASASSGPAAVSSPVGGAAVAAFPSAIPSPSPDEMAAVALTPNPGPLPGKSFAAYTQPSGSTTLTSLNQAAAGGNWWVPASSNLTGNVTLGSGTTITCGQAATLAATFNISGSGVTIQGCIIDGTGQSTSQLAVMHLTSATNLTIQNDQFQNCPTACIWGWGTKSSIFDHNTFTNMPMHGTESGNPTNGPISINGSNNQITNNLVLNANGGGIQVGAGPTDPVPSNNVISGNSLTNVCQTTSDCGALYLSDATGQAVGNQVTNNNVNNYGPVAQWDKCIYLDAGISNVTVTGNTCSGAGMFPVFYHGGSNNQVTGNNFQTASSGYMGGYQTNAGFSFGVNTPMRGNTFANNNDSGPTCTSWWNQAPGLGQLAIGANSCSGGVSTASTQ